ncbi:unnamed protein product [Xylocopa violacea]|uniref:Uncharacterized protein n=1 Tax=Xylocopa violacea TaxID=135666 RepID=A0ABP1N3E6_XYLVO
MLPSSKLLQPEPADSTMVPTSPRNPTNAPASPPSIVIEDVERTDDDPPPYSAIVPPDHVGWTFNYPRIPYSACETTACRAEATPLTRLQPDLPPGYCFHQEETESQHASISMPLMPYRLFMCGSHRSLFARGNPPETSASKDNGGRTRKYGAILVGAAVIIFLMVLSILVRIVMDKNLWRG